MGKGQYQKCRSACFLSLNELDDKKQLVLIVSLTLDLLQLHKYLNRFIVRDLCRGLPQSL